MSLDDFFPVIVETQPKNTKLDPQLEEEKYRDDWIKEHKSHGKYNSIGTYLYPIYHSNPSIGERSKELSFLGCSSCKMTICCYCNTELDLDEVKSHIGCRSGSLS